MTNFWYNEYMGNKYIKKWIIVLVVVLALFSIIWAVISALDFSGRQEVTFGVTFSHKYASQLGLDWTETYWAIINKLGVKNVRLAVYWDLIEEENNFFNLADYEWMVEEAAKKDVNIIMVIGRRTPRWPECHDPKWLASMDKEDQERELMEMLEKVVNHFKKYKNISVWQVENEPLLNLFGKCPPADKGLLAKEVALVRSLDTRPIMITDTGELSSWDEAASLADIFGITMYRVVWNRFIGVWRYPWPPAYYYFKAKRISKKYNLDKIIVSELQAEPWTKGGVNIREMKIWDQFDTFDLDDFRSNLEYVKRAGFRESYLWGVEWWYWLKKEKNHPEFWNEAKLIWQNN